MSNAVKLYTGFTSGCLTVVSSKPFKKVGRGALYYNAKCNCGHTQGYIGSKLKKGEVVNCPKCSARNKQSILLKKGDSVGCLVIISNRFKKKDNNRYSFRCICQCGDVSIYDASKLNTGKSTMCISCAYRKRPQSLLTNGGWDALFRKAILNRVKGTNIHVSINVQDFKAIATRNCYYCGARPYEKKWKKGLRTNGIDRIDNNKGYEVGNCVPCCPTCNSMKRSMNVSDFINHIKKILKTWIRRKAAQIGTM